MNFSQKLGLSILVLITITYVYFSFFAEAGFHFNSPISKSFSNNLEELPEIIEENNSNDIESSEKSETKTVKIYVADSKGNLRSVNRECDINIEKSCFEYAIKELIKAPTKWEKSKEINVGIEGATLNKRLTFEANYFNQLRDDIILKMTSRYSSIYGGYISYENAGKVLNHGFELDIRWNDSYGQFKYDIGANLTWTKNKVKNGNELDQPYDYLNKLGRPSDVILGYVSEGLFGKDIQLDGHPVQMFGDYGNGDIAYADLNNDQIIDEQDRRVIGNTYPRTFLGVDLNFSYKGWGLYILGTAQLGMDKVLNNRYYWNYGERKYSVKALDRYHPENNPDGNLPRLTTTNGSNNFRDSDFWTENSGFFRLKNVELSYTFTNIPSIKALKVYARGTNLLTFSRIKDLDPEVLNAGVTNYPIMMNITGGFSLTF